eukprot:TRINITY_DN9380_c0_g1_i1.p1 TRINITY_DN9380_c0_g1~~TRINITY_DN9380_c0_g1_i1.p1  ORF type:complete len:336 (+),score=39.10 TRINITY_DN9380_c0_g1_i1:71-1078(+)
MELGLLPLDDHEHPGFYQRGLGSYVIGRSAYSFDILDSMSGDVLHQLDAPIEMSCFCVGSYENSSEALFSGSIYGTVTPYGIGSYIHPFSSFILSDEKIESMITITPNNSKKILAGKCKTHLNLVDLDNHSRLTSISLPEPLPINVPNLEDEIFNHEVGIGFESFILKTSPVNLLLNSENAGLILVDTESGKAFNHPSLIQENIQLGAVISQRRSTFLVLSNEYCMLDLRTNTFKLSSNISPEIISVSEVPGKDEILISTHSDGVKLFDLRTLRCVPFNPLECTFREHCVFSSDYGTQVFLRSIEGESCLYDYDNHEIISYGSGNPGIYKKLVRF